MKTNRLRICFIGAALVGSQLLFHESAQAVQITNSWKNINGSKWEVPGNWSDGFPSAIGQSAIAITNSGFNMFLSSKTITLDQTSASMAPGSMTISNLIVAGVAGTKGEINTLLLSDTGSTNLTILDTLTVLSRGVLIVTNSGILLSSEDDTIPMLAVDGQATIENGTISGGNSSGDQNQGEVIGMNGTGTLTIEGGSDKLLFDSITIGLSPGSVGTVWLLGGVLSSASIEIGGGGLGFLIQSNGTVETGETDVGLGNNGTLTVAGGNNFPGILNIGSGGTGTVWITGGLISAGNNSDIQIGLGTLNQSNGVVAAYGEEIAGTLNLSGGLHILGDDALTVGGSVWVTGGELQANNAFNYSQLLGFPGTLTQSNGVVELYGEEVYVGTLTVIGGTHEVGFGGLILGDPESGTTGNVWVVGGQLLVNTLYSFTAVGNGATVFLTQSNGVVDLYGEIVGEVGYVGGEGTLSVFGGLHTVEDGGLLIGNNGSTGSVLVAGGQLNVEDATIGLNGAGAMTMSNGIWLAESVLIGAEGGNGTLTDAGGTSTVFSNVMIGTEDCTGTGTVIVAGGSLFVTNATHNAVLEVASGTLLLNSGTLVVDQLITTNSCGSFKQTGGTLVVGGVTNILAPFQITAIGREGNNLRITWNGIGGNTNVVQATNGTGGNYATNFTDLSSFLILPGSGNVVTNYLDLGGATNIPSRFYRVGLVP